MYLSCPKSAAAYSYTKPSTQNTHVKKPTAQEESSGATNPMEYKIDKKPD